MREETLPPPQPSLAVTGATLGLGPQQAPGEGGSTSPEHKQKVDECCLGEQLRCRWPLLIAWWGGMSPYVRLQLAGFWVWTALVPAVASGREK